MSQFRNKLIKEVVDPVQYKNRVRTIIAQVTGPKKSLGSKYNIKFINENGDEQEVSRVSVRQYGTETSGPFKPVIGQDVVVECQEHQYEIIGEYKSDAEIAAASKLSYDIYSNYSYDNYLGYIM